MTNKINHLGIDGKPRQIAWNVYLHGKKIDTVFYSSSYGNAEEVKVSLVDHDGYDYRIEVKKARYHGNRKQ